MLICPICGNNLKRGEKTYVCEKNHNFDIARQGYVNLLPASFKKTADPGDNAEMVNARHSFLSAGYYSVLSLFIADYIKNNFVSPVIIDAGCCEGYYSECVKNEVQKAEIFAVDISKNAVKKGSSVYKNIMFLVSSVFNLPFSDSSADIIMRIFAPIALQEYKRVLKSDGTLIEVVPGIKHLKELKDILYDNVRLNPEPENCRAGFELINSHEIISKIHIFGNENIENLFAMTPYFYTTDIKGKEKLNNIDELDVTGDFVVNFYKKM